MKLTAEHGIKNSRLRGTAVFCYLAAAVMLICCGIAEYVSTEYSLAGRVLSNYMFIGFELLICIGYLFDCVSGKCYLCGTSAQLLSVYLFFDIFFAAALLCPDNSDRHNITLILSEAVFLLAGSAFWTKQTVSDWKSDFIKRLTDKIKKNKGLLLLLAAGLIIGIDNLKIMPAWDNNIYLKEYFETPFVWDFSPGQLFRIKYAGHFNQSVTLIVMLCRWIGGSHAYMVLRLISLLSNQLTVIMIYSVVGRIITYKGLTRTLISAAILFFPTCLPMQMTTLDDFFYFYSVFWIFSRYNGLRPFAFLAALLMVFSKEPAIVLYFGFCVGILVARRNRTVKKCVEIGLPGITWGALYILPSVIRGMIPGASAVSVPTEAETESAGLIEKIISLGWNAGSNNNTFALDAEFATAMLKQFFTFNFMWIPVLACFVCLAVYGIHTAHERKVAAFDGLAPLIAGFICETAFLCLYITYNWMRYRYSIITILLLVCFTVIYRVLHAMDKRKLAVALAGALSAVFLVESYYMFDPVTLHIGKKISTGNGNLVSVEPGNLYVSDAIVVNHQGLEYVSFMEEVLNTIGYTENDLVVFPQMQCDGNKYCHLGVYSYYKKQTAYDEEEGRLILSGTGISGGTPVNRAYMYHDGTFAGIDDDTVFDREYENVYVLALPFGDVFDVKARLEEKFGIEFNEENEIPVNYRSWSCKVYRIDPACIE